jgi:hypothetical protein
MELSFFYKHAGLITLHSQEKWAFHLFPSWKHWKWGHSFDSWLMRCYGFKLDYWGLGPLFLVAKLNK